MSAATVNAKPMFLTLQQTVALSELARAGHVVEWDREFDRWNTRVEIYIQAEWSQSLSAIGFTSKWIPLPGSYVALVKSLPSGTDIDEIITEIELCTGRELGEPLGYMELMTEVERDNETPNAARWAASEVESKVENLCAAFRDKLVGEIFARRRVERLRNRVDEENNELDAALETLRGQVREARKAIDEKCTDWTSQTRAGGAINNDEHYAQGQADALEFALSLLPEVE